MRHPTRPSIRPTRTGVAALRPHQRDALAAIVRELENPDPEAVGSAPHGGRRATAVMACGTGKTWVAAGAAATLAARGRVLVLVPTLDLLEQTVTAWQRAGRTGGVQVAVCSLGGDAALAAAGVRATTSTPRLALWTGAVEGPVTVYATYQSLETILAAHRGMVGLRLPPWRLVVVDEGHRSSGRLGRPWTAVHDDRVLPALGRLYLTATPRVWEPADVSAYGEGTGRGDTGSLPLDADDDVWDDPDTTATDGLENDGADRDDEDEDFDNRNDPASVDELARAVRCAADAFAGG
ncbi:DEAD/DEAH box helicase family protein [Embleya scabrispora]|uniref:DEAD/DEAH box helicase family protein n=1 Tax=Embleya scabrispora TaxID=159449 RepID=UPI0003A410AF|nr:DEAD/DEAH box helicase family protein [Embleya scabrispora]